MATNRVSPKKGKVVDIPTVPTVGTATAGGASATVAYTASTKGGPTTTVTALSNPDSITGTGSSSPITVLGLTAGTAYTFTVRGTNATGSSEYSSASNSIIPIAVPASGMYLWYDADDAATITATSGNVSSWGDKSGNGFNATTSQTIKPKTGINTRNSKNVITFTQTGGGGYGGLFNGSTSWGTDPNLDVWIVKKHVTDTLGISGSAFGIGNDQAGNNKVYYSFLDRTNSKLLSGSSGGQIFSSATQLNNWVLSRFTKTGASAQFYLSGTSQGTASANYDLGSNNTIIGAIPQAGAPGGGVYAMEGDIAEIIVYKTVLTGADYTQTYNYLATKWGF
jgi:hypothetical protein